jgi:hypothetical protein
MEIGTISNPSLYLTDIKSKSHPVITVDLPSLIENMKHSSSRAKGELKAMILLNNPDRQILLTILPEKTEISAFQANDSVTIQIIEGELMFHSPRESLTIRKGQFLMLHEKVKYSLTNIQETVFLLTISNDNSKVVEN